MILHKNFLDMYIDIDVDMYFRDFSQKNVSVFKNVSISFNFIQNFIVTYFFIYLEF